MAQALRAALGVVLGLVARLWLATLRLRVEMDPALAVGPHDSQPWVLAFLHGKQWPLLAWKRRRSTVVMVSLSNDGAMQSRALGVLGLHVVRGSSSRGGVRGLAALVRVLKRGRHDAAFAIDGPRGPYGVAKPGVLLAAHASGALLVPMGSAVARGKVFTRAWDRFALAWPLSRVSVVLGAPLAAEMATVEALSEAVAAANARAEAILSEGGGRVIPFAGVSAAPLGQSRASE